MYARRIRITGPESREITVRLPSDVLPGEAELMVITESPATPAPAERFKAWLDSWIHALPDAPAISIEALRRENLYQ
jgi:hypothetical protein